MLLIRKIIKKFYLENLKFLGMPINEYEIINKYIFINQKTKL